jgi:hypothetical protein
MEGGGITSPSAERLRKVVDLAPRPGEDERRSPVLEVEDAAQRGQFVRRRTT